MSGAALALVVVACGGDQGREVETDAASSVTISSPALTESLTIPTRFTCDGAELSPPLRWSGQPPRAWALVVDDPDAPAGTFTHWVVLDIPAGTTSVRTGELPMGGIEVANSSGGTSYVGPCPPDGEHRYRFTIYGLDAPTRLTHSASLQDALAAVGDHATSRGTLTAVYSRS